MPTAYRGSRQSLADLPLVSAAATLHCQGVDGDSGVCGLGQGNVAGAAFSWLSSSMAAAADISQVVLTPCISKCSMARYMLSVHVRNGPVPGCCEYSVTNPCCLYGCI